MASRLKSLELLGYKTFASKTLLEYPAPITAVVGPNGAGKSNVADAIRWVLGEQSYSLLRGRKTEDMIFAGSEQRARASMASASITFDNEDGWLPIDFGEVSITRRAYRDGQNEYLLNGQRVRLKEISELLAQSGLAERTYTIIGQGLVDTALSLKPDERRRFFEEAAGIGLYRGRREEALNRLDNTRRNLERILDILSELEPRLQSLERQAKRVQEYERIKADLQVLLRDWYGYHWRRVQKEIIHARGALRAQEARLEQTRIKYNQIENQLTQTRNRLQVLRGNLNEWHAESAGYHSQREKVSRELAILDERQRSILDRRSNLSLDLAKLEEDCRARKEKLALLVEEQERYQKELEAALAQSTLASQALQKRQEERTAIEMKTKEVRRQLVQEETGQVRLRARNQELENRIETLQSSLDSARTSLSNENATFGDLENRLKKMERLAEEAQFAVEESEEALQTLRSRREELTTQRKQAQDVHSRLETESSRILAQYQVLEEAEKTFSGLNQGAQFLLETARKGRLGGGYQALSSLLDVPAKFEKAVAAALGEYLDGIVVDVETDPESALVLLEKEEKGRAVLLLLDARSEGRSLSLSGGLKALPLASNVVQAPKKIMPLVQRLLGQVVIVSDREGARKVVQELPETARVVTYSGEVFYGSGVVIAGRDNRSTVISRPRQKRELQENLAELDNKLEESATRIHKIDELITSLSSEEQKLIKEQNLLNQRLRDHLNSQQQAKLEVEQARQRIGWHKNQVVEVEAQIQKAGQEIQRMTGLIADAAQKIEALNLQLREYNRQLAGLPLDELQTQVAHWNTGAAVASQTVKSSSQRLDEHRQSIAANLAQQEDLRTRSEKQDALQKELEKTKADLRAEEIRLNQQIDTIQSKIEPAEKDLETLEKEYNSAQENQMTAQQAVTVAERHATQAQLELTRQREVLDNLRGKIEDDFGLVSYEYSTNFEGQEPLPFGTMVKDLPVLVEISPDLEENINRQRSLLRRIGAINPDAMTEYQAVLERYSFLKTQIDDLEKADADLRQVIGELDELMRREFRKTFDAVATEFRQMFTRLFGGGSARLVLTDEENPTETGIDIEARLPGRREQGLSLLSGGERSLTAVALIFALLKVSPTPFCVMDEVDAMLDEANVGRFCELLKELSEKTQFIVITHNRNTVQTSDVIYGVTMGRDSASQLISLRLDELSEEMVD